jgi:hypothetical protein
MYIPLTFEGSLGKCLYASGGLTNGTFISGSDEYEFHLYNNNSTFTITNGTVDNVTILLVGGGGGGGWATSAAQGGGGGGVTLIQNQRLYPGTYSIIVGKGGLGSTSTISNQIGDTGTSSSFSGSGLYITASGGGGGGYFGNDTGTGVSGNGFAGGSSTSTYGGGGGGAVAVGQAGNTTNGAGDGGNGIEYANSDRRFAYAFGCGGGGSRTAAGSGQVGFSCNSTSYGAGCSNVDYPAQDGNPGYGGGGGAGLRGYTGAGDGGDGCVYIQYKINSYCKNFNHKTGSCECREITFNTDPIATYDPLVTGSYAYVPCGTSTLVTGSVQAYYPITVCATSGAFFVGPTSSSRYQIGYNSTGSQCSTWSNVCGTSPIYTSSCSSSYFTYFGSGYTYYVGRNSDSISYSEVDNNYVQGGAEIGRYVCQSSILTNPSGSSVKVAPTVNSPAGTFIKLDGSKCLVLNWQSTLVTSATSTLHWYDCTGTLQTYTFTFPGTVNYTFTASFAVESPWYTGTFIGSYDYVTTGNDYTGSLPACGCP